MYIEFEPGQKFAKKGAEISESPDAFNDCGYLLTDDEVVIDIDTISKDKIKAYLEMFNVRTQVIWTDRGAHLYFRKPENFTRAKNGPCALGFSIETKHMKNTPRGITVKRNGKLRKVDNEGVREMLPWYFSYQKKFSDLTGLSSGDGRNNRLYSHRMLLDSHEDTGKILRFINSVLFDDPLPDDELDLILRQLDTLDGDLGKEYGIATAIKNQYRCVLYQGSIWCWNGERYFTDAGDDSRLKKIVFERCPGKTTRFVDEVIKQLYYRSDLMKSKAYPVRLLNGIVTDGKFIEVDNYQEFTPYYIDIEYKKDAAVVPLVDKYIDDITGNDKDYRKLLLEAMAYVLVTDPEVIRRIGQFFFLRGDGANGKGTLLQIMAKIYNQENCTALSIKEITDTRYQVTMVGKLVNLGDDIQPDAITNDQMKALKNIATADTIETRFLYKQSFRTTFTAKMFFTTNSDIRTFEKGYAYKRRVKWLPMFNKVEKPDPKFITKMTTKEALEYWIRLIVEAYERLYKNGELSSCEVVEEYNKQYHVENNYMAVFVQTLDIDRDIIGKTGPEVREMYREYNDDDTKPYKPKLLMDYLKEQGIGKGLKKINGKSTRVFMRQVDTEQKIL